MLPFGAPGDIPPCIRQRPFGIAADRHGLPLLVRAPHRGLWCMGNLLRRGLFLRFPGLPMVPSTHRSFIPSNKPIAIGLAETYK